MSPDRPAGMDKLLTDARIITGIVLTAAIIIAALSLMMIGHPEHIETTTLGLLLGAALTLTGLATWSSVSAARATAALARRVAARPPGAEAEPESLPAATPPPVDPLLGPQPGPLSIERWRATLPPDPLGTRHGEAGTPDASPHPPEGERGE